MEESQPSKPERKREKESISVPFIWEEQPGTPKKDWKPSPGPIKPTTPPVKLVVSIPFGWEEKPGMPLLFFTQPQPEMAISPPQTHPVDLSPDHGNWSPTGGGVHDCNNDERGGLSDSDLETCSFHTNDSFSSAPSLLANDLRSTSALATDVPVEQSSLALNTVESPDSPPSNTDSTTSTYATGSTSLAGDSFLQWLFPLLVPNSDFRNKLGNLEMDYSNAADVKDVFLHEGNQTQAWRPLLTLGELIVISRRRSYQRKIKMHKQPSMDFMKRNGFSGGILGNVNGISELHRKWKRQLQLKLM